MSDIKNWREEKRSAYLYRIMEKSERHPLRKKLFHNLAKAAEDQARIWEKRVTAKKMAFTSAYYPSSRTRFVGWLVTQLGPEKMRYILSAMKVRGMSIFSHHNHEARHTLIGSAGNLRAAVFGVNDGLISNMSLILGIAGANNNHSLIMLAGVAGLLAGACSMAAGEYVSVSSQREVYEHQIDLERKELALYPEEEAEELALIYETRGLPKDQAAQIAALFINNPETALDTLAREELGLNPNELGSPIGAMISSFISFSAGALIPMLPFMVGHYAWDLQASIVLTMVCLFIIGSLTSLFTDRSALKNGFRMLLIGTFAGAFTYLIGKIMGVSLF